MTRFDLIVIGAGPAGMAAAIQAAQFGVSVAIIDEQANAGGQIYRNLKRADNTRQSMLGQDYQEGHELIASLASAHIRHIDTAIVWDVAANGTVTYSQYQQTAQISAEYVLIATGALERPTPIRGWTLPGVMSVGAAQILLKTAGLVAEDAVLAGSGPLLYLMATQMIKADCPPRALIETQTNRDLIRGLQHSVSALRGYKPMIKGIRMLQMIRRAGIPRYTAAHSLEVHGEQQANAISFCSGPELRLGSRLRIGPGSGSGSGQQRISCSSVLLHQGLIPNTQITRSLAIKHSWHKNQRCFQPESDKFGQTSLDGFYVAGDGSGIGGAGAAEANGRLSAIDILHKLGRLERKQRDALQRAACKSQSRELAIRPFLDAMYPPPQAIRQPPDDVLVCRCEAVSAGEIRQFAKLGCVGPNQTKAFSRAGMGPCQGRYCGTSITEILADEHRQSPEQIGSYRIRSPLKPVTLGEIASAAHPSAQPFIDTSAQVSTQTFTQTPAQTPTQTSTETSAGVSKKRL